MVDRLITWYHTLTWEKVLLAVAQWLTASSFIIFLTFSTDLLYSFSFLRNTLFRLITVVLTLIYVLLFSLNRSYRPRLNRSLVTLCLLFLTYCLSALINGTAGTSFWGDYLRMDGLYTMGTYLIFTFVVAMIFRTFNDWQKVFQVSFFIAFLTALVAFSQSLNHSLLIQTAGGGRVSSTFGNVSYYGFFQSVGFFLSLYLAFHPRLKQVALLIWFFALADMGLIIYELYAYFLHLPVGPLVIIVTNLYLLLLWLWPQFWLLRFQRGHKPWQRWCALGSMLALQLLAIWLSGARSSILATGLGLLFFLAGIATYKSRRRLSKKYILPTLIVLGLTIIITFLIFRVDIGRAIKSWEYNSLSDRFVVWKISWDAFRAKPLVGWGPENYTPAFNQYYDDAIFRSGVAPIWYDKAHNIFLQHLVEGGVIALGLYLLLWFWLIRTVIYLWRHRPAERLSWLILTSSLLVYTIQSFLYFDTINNQLFFYLIVAYVISRQAESQDTIDKYGLPLRLPFGRPMFFTLMVIVAVLFSYNFQLRSWQANLLFTRQLVAIRSQLPQVKAESLEQLAFDAGRSPSLGKAELRYQYVLLISDLITRGSTLDIPSLKQQISLAETVLAKNIMKRPNDADLYLEMANFYLLAGRIDPIYWQRGLELSEKIRSDNPKRTQLLYLEGQFDLALGQKTAGLDLFHQATLLRPDVLDTHIQYYKQLSNSGELKLAQGYFDQYLMTATPPDLLKLVQFDLATHHLDLARQHLEILKQTKKLPQDVAILSSLLLLAQGKAGEATSSAQETIRQYPQAYPVLSQYFTDLKPLVQ